MQEAISSIRAPEMRNGGDRSSVIYNAILYAILEHRLPVGTRLVEDEIGAIFGTSRTIVRSVLQSLAHERLVAIERHRGAFVARPSAAEARNVYGARRMIEPGLAREAAARFAAADDRRLLAHLEREERALAARRRGVAIRLSGEFHLRVAEAVGNETLTRIVAELISFSSLVVALYGRTGASACGTADHRVVLEALRARDGEAAAAAMLAHLGHIEADIDLDPGTPRPVDLAAILTAPQD